MIPEINSLTFSILDQSVINLELELVVSGGFGAHWCGNRLFLERAVSMTKLMNPLF